MQYFVSCRRDRQPGSPPPESRNKNEAVSGFGLMALGFSSRTQQRLPKKGIWGVNSAYLQPKWGGFPESHPFAPKKRPQNSARGLQRFVKTAFGSFQGWNERLLSRVPECKPSVSDHVMSTLVNCTTQHCSYAFACVDVVGSDSYRHVGASSCDAR